MSAFGAWGLELGLKEAAYFQFPGVVTTVTGLWKYLVDTEFGIGAHKGFFPRGHTRGFKNQVFRLLREQRLEVSSTRAYSVLCKWVNMAAAVGARGRNDEIMCLGKLAEARFHTVCGSWMLPVTMPRVAGSRWAALAP